MRKLIALAAKWLNALMGRGSAAPVLAGGAEERFVIARQQMVTQQLVRAGRDITDARVLAAMAKVPRHEFVPGHLREKVYDDGPLPIGHGQTISQPYVVAFMTERLEPKPADRVLEIGTGSGYQAAILAELVAEVYAIEIVPELAARASATLNRLGYTNVQVRLGDGWSGWPEAAPFDAIMLTCAPEELPQSLIDQLKDGGRMVAPEGRLREQEVIVVCKHRGKLERRPVLPVRFVPMVGNERGGVVK